MGLWEPLVARGGFATAESPARARGETANSNGEVGLENWRSTSDYCEVETSAATLA